MEVVGAVQDAAAEAEAAGAGTQVAPVPQGGDRRTKEVGRFGDGEQLGLVVGGAIVTAGILIAGGRVDERAPEILQAVTARR